jgi:two-component system KDP operon response regulator KdpE
MQEEFEHYLHDVAVPHFESHPGLISVRIGAPNDVTPDEFLVTTVWRDLNALKSFAGERWFEARIGKQEARLLKDTYVHHYQDSAPPVPRHPSARRTRREVDGADALLALGDGDVEGIVSALRERGVGVLVAPTGRAGARLLQRWAPKVAVVSADSPDADRLLYELESDDVPVILIGHERDLRVPARVKTLAAALLIPAAPAEIASAVEIVAGRRPINGLPDMIEAGRVHVDARRRMVRVNGEVLELAPREFALLAELALRPGHPVPSTRLAHAVWPEAPIVTADDVRRTVYRLRRAIGDHERDRPLIRHRRGYGYLLEP